MKRTSDRNRSERVGDIARRMTSAVRTSPRSRSYPLVGLLLAPGAPIGFVFAGAFAERRLPTVEMALAGVSQAPLLHAYLLLATAVVLVSLGHLLGRWFDHARILAVTDPLTGLYNRRHFGERLAEELRRSLRHGRPTCVLCLDVDHLKAINDGAGHRAGDHALVTVSRSLSRNVRATDVVARFGGDEFALLLPRTSAIEASALARRIHADVARHGESLQSRLTASIGIAELDASMDIDTEDFIAAADSALYRAKAAGGGHTSVVLLNGGAPTGPRLAPALREQRAAAGTQVRAGAPER